VVCDDLCNGGSKLSLVAELEGDVAIGEDDGHGELFSGEGENGGGAVFLVGHLVAEAAGDEDTPAARFQRVVWHCRVVVVLVVKPLPLILNGEAELLVTGYAGEENALCGILFVPVDDGVAERFGYRHVYIAVERLELFGYHLV